MIAVLSLASSRGIWILADEAFSRLHAGIGWDDGESTGHFGQVPLRFEELLKAGGVSRESLTSLLGVTGPGGFTGLRIGGAFLQGLSRALKIPLYGIPTSSLVATPGFWIPMQHQRAKLLSREEALASGMDFLRIEAGAASAGRPADGDLVLGLQDRVEWPTADELLAAARRHAALKTSFVVEYGLEPKISGRREPS